MIQMKAIVKSFITGGEKLVVLKSIDVSIAKGEFVAILGPSGSGKSTLMNIIGCMDAWDSGEYFLDGIPIHKRKGESLTRIRNEKIGFIFQKYQLIPTYTVQQNVIMPLIARGMSSRKAMQVAKPTIELLGLSTRMKHRPNQLSGGQQQRVAVARALVCDPAILLADEPTGALDSKTGAEVIALFHRLHKMGNTIIMITHDEKIAKEAERIIRIVDGNIILPEDMEQKPAESTPVAVAQAPEQTADAQPEITVEDTVQQAEEALAQVENMTTAQADN